MNARKSRSDPRRGFALVITVILLALLLLVLVSTATLTHIETSIGFNSRRQSQAQQNALFALNRAIGELQRHAGPDTRTTARADILSTSTGSTKWTGAWAGGSGGPQTWLVSGNEDGVISFEPSGAVTGLSTSMTVSTPVMVQPTSGPVQGGALLVGPSSAGATTANYVVAPLIPLTATAADGTANTTVGRYAWWVGDEGVKASITETERQGNVNFDDVVSGEDYTNPSPANGNRDRIAQLAQPRQRIEPMFPTVTYDTTTEPQLRKVLAPAQISFVTASSPLTPGIVRPKFHDFTAWSRGVLADPALGGLKEDLSDPLAATVDALDPRLAGFLQLRPGALPSDPDNKYSMVAPYRVGLANPGATSAAQYWVAPVVSEFRMVLTNPQNVGGEVIATLDWKIELWNPYNVELELSELHVSFDDQETFETIEFPGVKIDWFRTIAGLEWVPGPERLVIRDSGATKRWEADLPLSGENVLSPGQIVIVGLPSPTPVRLRDSTGTVIPSTATPTFVFTAPSVDEPITVTLADPDDVPISVHFPPVSSTAGDPVAAIQFRLRDGADAPDWLVEYDPRAPEIRDSPSYTPYAADRMSGLVATDTPIAMSSSEIAAGALVTTSAMRVFDLPRQEQVSIGALQHFSGTSLPTENMPAIKLGQPWGLIPDGGLDNALFDRAFFSTIPRDPDADWNPATESLPNTRIEIYNPDPSNPATIDALVALGNDASDDRLSASRLLVRGAFNLNSKSAEAWQALTSGTAVTNWKYWFGPNQQATLARAFFRHTQTGQDLGTPFSAKPSPANSWRQGVRDLTALQATGIASFMAQHVGDAFDDINGAFIKSAGEPFRSIADFVDSGILQAAIDAADVGSINSGLTPLSPGYVTQADILTAWAPFLQARSDTFLVRTYGEAVNPVTGITEARAWCEAVVQRVPDYVNSVDDDAWEAPTGDNIQFGRRFKIVQFRWLSPADI